MGPWMATALVMGLMIGSGVFLLPAQMAPFGWNGVVGWIISIGGALVLALLIARLTQNLPESDGPVGFVNTAFGSLPAFLIGFSYWVSNWLTVVTLAVAAVSYLSVFVPVIATTPYLPTVLAVALVWIMTLINLSGARAAGSFQIITMAIKLVPLLLVVVLLTHAGVNGRLILQPFPAQGLDWSTIPAATSLTLFALLGFEAASVAAAAVRDPARNIPIATIAGTSVTGFLYLIVCSGIALALPVAQIAHSDAPFALFVETMWARGPALLIAFFAAVAAIGAANACILLLGELPRTMAEQGSVPRWFAGTTEKGVPQRAILLSSAIATVFVMFYASKSIGDLFAFLAKLTTSTTIWLYLLCGLAALRLRIALPLAMVGTAFSLWALWGAGIDISALSLVLMFAGLPLYLIARKAAGKEGARHAV